jgi:WD40 repeat protein
MRRLGLLVVVSLLGVLAPAVAHADVFGPISLASESEVPHSASNQQASYAHDAAISGNGRYVAFDGSYAGHTGVWRRDLQTGVVQMVAAAEPSEPSISAPDAELPSISESGQYVSFTTTARLDPIDDTNSSPDVYVRNMDISAAQQCEPGADTAEPCAFTLGSAANGSSTGLTYEPSGTGSRESEEDNYGSLAAARSAISADGRKVVFVTTAISNLAGTGTPAMQVAVRDLDSEQTELVSVADEPATGAPILGRPVLGQESGGQVYGAVFTGTGGTAPIFRDPQPYGTPPEIGASISADGTTVAWMGVDVAEQVRLLGDEAPKDSYTEPLWRRIGDGPSAPIRRVTGGSDTGYGPCLESGQSALPGVASLSNPCQGPFDAFQESRLAGIWSAQPADPVPRLSGDGYSVAFIANAPLAALGADFGGTEPNSDLYLVNMREPLTRAQALHPLTELAGGDQSDIAENAPIVDFAISADGQQLAFTTKRTVFPLGSPSYVSAPQATAGMLELFAVDLHDDTLTRVSNGFAGGPSEHPHEPKPSSEDPYPQLGDGALSPSFSDDGNTIAFSSTASNLVFGDGNTPPLGATKFDGSDAFVVSRTVFNGQPTPQSISAVPAGPTIAPLWRLGVTARSRADGSVVLYVTVPGVGAVKAVADSAVRVRSKRHGHVSTTVAMRSVATSKRAAFAADGELLTLILVPTPRYRALAERRPGLAGTVSVSFAAAHRPALKQNVRVSFLRTRKSEKHGKPKTKAAGNRPHTAPAGGR